MIILLCFINWGPPKALERLSQLTEPFILPRENDVFSLKIIHSEQRRELKCSERMTTGAISIYACACVYLSHHWAPLNKAHFKEKKEI